MVLGGLSTMGQASTALRATLAALGERIPDEDRDAIARDLPDEVAAILRKRRYRGAFDVAELFERIRRRERVNLGFAREHGQVVCRVLGEALRDETHQRVERVLPAAFVELLYPSRSESSAPDHPPARAPGHHTLASGRAGSAHPLSESRPPVAQSHSVVREANPHADTKLSSTPGMTQERLDESLAAAHPDTKRALSNASE